MIFDFRIEFGSLSLVHKGLYLQSGKIQFINVIIIVSVFNSV